MWLLVDRGHQVSDIADCLYAAALSFLVPIEHGTKKIV
jgi:hypothetical protein